MGCTTSSELEAGQVSEATQKELEHRIQQLAGNKTGGQVQQAEIAPGESVNAADPSDVLLMIKRNLPSLSDQVVSAPSTMLGRRGSTCTAAINVTKPFFSAAQSRVFRLYAWSSGSWTKPGSTRTRWSTSNSTAPSHLRCCVPRCRRSLPPSGCRLDSFSGTCVGAGGVVLSVVVSLNLVIWWR